MNLLTRFKDEDVYTDDNPPDDTDSDYYTYNALPHGNNSFVSMLKCSKFITCSICPSNDIIDTRCPVCGTNIVNLNDGLCNSCGASVTSCDTCIDGVSVSKDTYRMLHADDYDDTI